MARAQAAATAPDRQEVGWHGGDEEL